MRISDWSSDVCSSDLPFPSIVAASRNDPFIDFGRAHTLAKFWGAHCADAGEVGHINAQSHLGEWEYGQYLLNQLIAIVSDSQPQHPRQSIDSMARARSVEDKRSEEHTSELQSLMRNSYAVI